MPSVEVPVLSDIAAIAASYRRRGSPYAPLFEALAEAERRLERVEACQGLWRYLRAGGRLH